MSVRTKETKFCGHTFSIMETRFMQKIIKKKNFNFRNQLKDAAVQSKIVEKITEITRFAT